jgi:hypothetical protein
MADQNAIKSLFSNDDVRGILGDNFDTPLTDAEAGVAGAAIDGSIAAYMLFNFMVFNPAKEEMDQVFSPLSA